MRMNSISVETLAKQQLVVLDRKRYSEFHRALRRILAPFRPNVATESSSLNSFITEIGIGKCVGVVSLLFKQAVGGRLLYRKLTETEVVMSVGIARAKGVDLAPSADNLCSIIRKTTKV